MILNAGRIEEYGTYTKLAQNADSIFSGLLRTGLEGYSRDSNGRKKAGRRRYFWGWFDSARGCFSSVSSSHWVISVFR